MRLLVSMAIVSSILKYLTRLVYCHAVVFLWRLNPVVVSVGLTGDLSDWLRALLFSYQRTVLHN